MHLFKVIECETPRMNLNVTMDFVWLWYIIVDLIVKKEPLWWGILIMKEAVHMWERDIWEISVSFTQFCCEAKTTLKTKYFLKALICRICWFQGMDITTMLTSSYQSLWYEILKSPLIWNTVFASCEVSIYTCLFLELHFDTISLFVCLCYWATLLLSLINVSLD